MRLSRTCLRRNRPRHLPGVLGAPMGPSRTHRGPRRVPSDTSCPYSCSQQASTRRAAPSSHRPGAHATRTFAGRLPCNTAGRWASTARSGSVQPAGFGCCSPHKEANRAEGERESGSNLIFSFVLSVCVAARSATPATIDRSRAAGPRRAPARRICLPAARSRADDRPRRASPDPRRTPR